jgi:hypothetical protein
MRRFRTLMRSCSGLATVYALLAIFGPQEAKEILLLVSATIAIATALLFLEIANNGEV